METTTILQQCTVEGNIVKLPPIQLNRNDYLGVKSKLELIGGKWKGGKTQGFVFEDDPTDLLAQIAGGENRNIKKEYQFFETPDDLADELVRMAQIKSTDTVLEPSAGRGAIVRAVHRQHPEINVRGFEIMDLNLSFLAKIDRFTLLGHDFLTEDCRPVDVIVANPPFAKNQDIQHINRMYSLLRSGGRLVTVASIHWQFTGGKKETAFRNWLGDIGAEVIPVASGEFKDSGTMVRTCIVKIQKAA